jgi:hypothetical protein
MLEYTSRELETLLNARQIVSREQLTEQKAIDAAQLAIHDVTGRIKEIETFATDPYIGVTLVDQVKAILSEAPWPIGPSEIRQQLAVTGRSIPQNVMTGILSRLARENRVVRESRGKYRLPTSDEVEMPNQIS